MAAETADRTFFDGDQRLMVAGQVQDQVTVQRFGKTGVGHCGGQAAGGQGLGGLKHVGQASAEGQDRHAGTFAHHPATAYFQWHAACRHINASAFTARITKGDGAVIMGDGGGDHVNQFRLIRCGHHHETGQIGQKRHIERSGMGGPIGPHQPGAIYGKAHRQALDGDIMHDLVIAALQEG